MYKPFPKRSPTPRPALQSESTMTSSEDMPKPHSAPVVLYTKKTCGFCYRALRLLASKGVAYQDVSIDLSPERQRQVREWSGQRTVPQIWIGGDHVGGCDDLFALERSGNLDDLLSAAASR